MRRKMIAVLSCIAIVLSLGIGSAFAATSPTPITVTITGHQLTVDYDGKAHSVSGFDWTVDPAANYTEKDFSFSGTASIEETNVNRAVVGEPVGKYMMNLSDDDFTNLNDDYEVKFVIKSDGYLQINPIDVTVTVTEDSPVENFTGSKHSASGYSSKVASNPLYNVTKLEETKTANWTVSGTNAGTYELGISSEDFTNVDPNFENVKVEIKDGALVIQPKLTIRYWYDAVDGKQAAPDSENWVSPGDTKSFPSPEIEGWKADKESVTWTAPEGNLSEEESTEVIDVVYTESPDEPTDPDKPINPDKPDNPSNGSTPSTPDSGSSTSLPATGDSSTLGIFLALFFASGAIAALVSRRLLKRER